MLQLTNSFPQIQITILVNRVIFVSYQPIVCKEQLSLWINWFILSCSFIYLMLMMGNLCFICVRKIQILAKVIECKVCLGLCHIKCLSLNSEEQQHIVSSSSCWYCCHSIAHILPFNHILDDEEFRDTLSCEDVTDEDWKQFSYKLFDHMGNSKNDDIYPLDEIDPDVHFCNELSYNLSSNCRYYHEDVFKMEYSMSIFQFVISISGASKAHLSHLSII